MVMTIKFFVTSIHLNNVLVKMILTYKKHDTILAGFLIYLSSQKTDITTLKDNDKNIQKI